MVKTKDDLTGMVFVDLTVIRQTDDYISPGGQRHAAWLCQCKFGNPHTSVITARGLHLKNGIST